MVIDIMQMPISTPFPQEIVYFSLLQMNKTSYSLPQFSRSDTWSDVPNHGRAQNIFIRQKYL
jgi:hypothetical protein